MEFVIGMTAIAVALMIGLGALGGRELVVVVPSDERVVHRPRERQRAVANRELLAEVTPSGRPVKKGWRSSGFGKRTDPFNGKKSYHRGVDFAGKRGAEVVAVASGVVIVAPEAETVTKAPADEADAAQVDEPGTGDLAGQTARPGCIERFDTG